MRAFLLTLLLLGCGPEPPAQSPDAIAAEADADCPPESERLAISTRYHAEVDRDCPTQEWRGRLEACPGYADATARYEQRRKAWRACP